MRWATLAFAQPVPSKQLIEYESFANELADAARKAILPYWRLPTLEVDSKFESGRSVSQTISPVSAADRAAERSMRDLIEERYPSHGICGEEYGSIRMDAEWVWVLDPIDGTKSFVTGKPLFGTLISALHKGIPTIGIIDQCILDERWVGVAGCKTTLNGKPVSTSSSRSPDQLKDAIMYATTPDMFTRKEESKRFRGMRAEVSTTNYGADCYGYALVASGFGAHVVVEADLGLYDYCAIVPVVEGAGGVMTDWTGAPLTLDNHDACKGRVVACSNKALHDEALKILHGPRPLRAKMSRMIKSTEAFPSLLIGVLLGKLWSWLR